MGETASEADSSETSLCEKESGHEKDEDVIRCICGLYKDEGLMIQCDKCMVRAPKDPCPALPGPSGEGQVSCSKNREIPLDLI